MAENAPGFDQEIFEELQGKYGPAWEDKLKGKWGQDWVRPASQDMEQALGSGWESQSADNRSQALFTLIDTAEGAARGEGASAKPSSGDDAPAPSLDGRPWMQTLLEADSFEAWLTRIGIDVSQLPSQGSSASPATGSAGQAGDDAPAPSLDGRPWMQTLLEADSFEAWLTRIGIDVSQLPSRPGG